MKAETAAIFARLVAPCRIAPCLIAQWLIALCLVIGAGMPGQALAGPKDDISASLQASATFQGQRSLIGITSQDGWSCSGHAKLPEERSGKSGSKGKSASARPVSLRLKCSDGSSARAEVTRDSDRREWSISFRHKEYGRAELRAREN